MRNLRVVVLTFGLAMFLSVPSRADVSVRIGVGLPHLSIGINVPAYPDLVPVPGYPVYYAPRVPCNYFFYDGFYWVYQDRDWFMSYWYNGPWYFVEPVYVPHFILRVPVSYYMQPPGYFYGWHRHEPPHWGKLWGREWERERRGWNRWDRRENPLPAPLPHYQKPYNGSRYPSLDQQRQLSKERYRYQSRDRFVRENILPRIKEKPEEVAPRAPRDRTRDQEHVRTAPETRRSWPVIQGVPLMQGSPPHRPERSYEGREDRRRLHPYGYEQRVRERFAPKTREFRENWPRRGASEDGERRSGQREGDARQRRP